MLAEARIWSVMMDSMLEESCICTSKLNSKRNLNYPQFSDHYFTGDYPIKPSDNIKGLKVQQLSLLSGKSNN